MSGSALPRSTPSAAGVDAAGISAFVDALTSTPGIDPHSLMLIRGGTVVAEGWWAPYAPDRVHLLYSLSKSFTSTALGFAVAEGLVDLDATVLGHFPELDADITDPRSRALTVRHLAAMAAGHPVDMLEPAKDVDPVDLVRGFLLLPPDGEPGTVFAYSQPCTFTVGAIVQRVSGGSLTEWLRPRLFEPLGIGEVGWQRDASGREIGYSGLHAVTEAIAALGVLYLQRGRWGDRQLLPASWVDEATRPQVSTAAEGNPDWQQGYGYQFWMARHGYRGDGAYGQYCIVLPEHDTVLAITSQTPQMQSVLDLVWEHVLPALAGPGSAAADEALAARLAHLTLPVVTGEALVADGRTLTAAAGNDQPTVSGLRVTGDPAGVRVVLTEGERTLEYAVGQGEWAVTDVVAASGAMVDGVQAIDLVFLETPHRLQLRVPAGASEFTAHWVSAPLWTTPLAALRMPS
ncbi:serine hydrolase domain-containing protein [Nakamurella deserti]|uniref:serine hydrolase domain-containing protein n=1 Tax=Nakamurella deserti TaxID=2164074 RepID=UPI000DBE2F39|nr:serine hydrolase domain-containing protein [Nakamurella deserti]